MGSLASKIGEGRNQLDNEDCTLLDPFSHFVSYEQQ